MLRSFVRNVRVKGVSTFVSSRASLSFGQIRKKDANGNFIESEVDNKAQDASAFSKEEKLTPEQVQAIQKAVRAQIENQLHDAFKERISLGRFNIKADPEGAAKLEAAEAKLGSSPNSNNISTPEPVFNMSLSQLNTIRAMEYELQDLRAKVRQSELFNEQVKPTKDFGAHKNLPLFTLVLAILVFSTSLRLGAMDQAKQLTEKNCEAKIKEMDEEAELAAMAAKSSFDALALMKTGKKEQAEQATAVAVKHFQKYNEKFHLRKVNEDAVANQTVA